MADPDQAKSQPKTLIGVVGGVAAAGLLALVPMLEGMHNDPYLDIVKIPTECGGHTGPDVVMGVRKTDAQCQAILSQDLVKHAQGVLACTPSLKGHDYQLIATVSFAFNVGNTAYCHSTMAADFKAGQYAQGCAELSKWVYAGGKPVDGLINRRARERAICEKGL